MPRAKGEENQRTLTRAEDFVVLSGKDLPALIGAEVADLRLYACSGADCKPVPVQVDKIDAIKRYVFAQEKNADRDGTRFDDNDEIAFMASDAGGRAPSGFRPEKSTRGAEIELRDPLDDGRAWVYLFDEPGAAPPTTADYIDYVVEDGNAILRSPQYELGWGLGMINANYLRLLTPDGKLSPDLLDRQKVGIQARLVGDRNLPIEAPESLIKARDLAVIDGPVRVIIDQDVVIHVANLDIKWGAEYFVKYYRCGQNNSVYLSFPTAANVFKTISFYWSLDFNSQVLGSSYLDANHPEPLPISVATVASVPDDAPHYWWGLYGGNGALLQALTLDDDILEYFACSGRWLQDADARDRKGDHPGRLEIGFTCGEKNKIPEKQDYHWLNYILFPKDPTADGVRQLQNLVEHPIQTVVSNPPA